MYTTVLGKAAPASAELAFDNSAILLQSRVSLRKIASDIKAQTAAKASGLFPKTPLVGCALSSAHPTTRLNTTVLGKATPASAELAFDNSAILLRSRVSLRKIASDIKAQTAAKASGLFPKTPLLTRELNSVHLRIEVLKEIIQGRKRFAPKGLLLEKGVQVGEGCCA